MGNQSEFIKDDIVRRLRRRQLLPGDPVDEQDIQERLSVSGTPIREALISLEAEGIVERRRRGGAIIAELDLETIMKLAEILGELDGTIAALASRRITPHEAEILKEKTQACVDHVEGSHSTSYYEKNYEFHLAVAKAAGNEHLIDLALGVVRRLFPYLSLAQDLPGEMHQSANEHVDICEAILDSDATRARELMVTHGALSHSTALKVLNEIRS